ncbi:MAG: TIGR04282 family arsenosugar biosynthesis glycosyltransferase [Syntrophaceae bacterium]|nr:TIGR04282 family arsenosugar biosynthesis glycosyltransferase [Syntrophaceae bacterium]
MDETGRKPDAERCLVMMAKYPESGQVKTRLATDLGVEHACELYRCFILDLLQNLSSEAWSCWLALHPWEKKEAMAAVVGGEIVQIPQRGNDLGERMDQVFREVFAAGFQTVVLIGSDAPDLPAEFVTEAFDALTNHDAVIGPASDGGYYLIGFHRAAFREDLFTQIPWSVPETFSAQMKRFRDCSLRVYILPVWQDIDTLADLTNMARLGCVTPFAGSQTMTYIRSSGLVLVS